MRAILACLLIATLAACQPDRDDIKPDLPDAGHAVAPTLIEVERRVYVRIPERLTKTEAVPEGPITECFAVGAQRRGVIERLNARLRAIEAIQGTEVQP